LAPHSNLSRQRVSVIVAKKAWVLSGRRSTRRRPRTRTLVGVGLIRSGPGQPGRQRRPSLTLWLWSLAVWLLVVWFAVFMLQRW